MTPRSESSAFDVIVVGLGPTGATLASLLALCGTNVLVLDRYDEPYPLPRAVHFDDEIMRVFQTIGIADRVTEIIRVNLGMRFVDAAGKLLLDWPRPQEIGPQGWHASYRFHQPDLEKLLREAVSRHSNVEIRTGKEVHSVIDCGDCVQIGYSDIRDGEKSVVSASYVVGCDGANSMVRSAMAVTETDLGFKERWLVADLLLNKPKPELGDHTIQYCNPERPATYARGPGNRRRWEITVLDSEQSDEVCAPDAVWALLQRWIKPHEAELERAAVYTFQSIIADQWRKGRMLIAGDAAHRTPPFMGQGLCAGVRDAANLAWKLGLVVKGLALETILDSYGTERTPHAREYIETAVRLGRLINASGSREALDAAFRQSDGTVKMQSIYPALGPGLTADNHDLRGALFPQPTFGNGQLMDDIAGYAPVLVIDSSFGSRATKIVTSVAPASSIQVLEAEPGSTASAWLQDNNTSAVLVRPDRYVLGGASNLQDLERLIAAAPPSPL